MGNHQKLKEKILRDEVPSDIRPKELQKFLGPEGFALLRSRGDHFIYQSPNGGILVIPMSNPIKQVYIRKIRDAIKEKDGTSEGN